MVGRRIISLSYDQLGAIGVHAPVIGRYERGEVKPSIEVAYKIASVLGVSLDFLVGFSEQLIDKDMLSRISDIQNLADNDPKHLFAMMDAFLRDAKARAAYA